MGRLHRVLSLSAAEQRLLFKAALLLGLIKLGLKLLPFRTVWQVVDAVSRPSFGFGPRDAITPDRIAWAVRVTGRYLLRARPCLTQALAVRVLLMRRRHPAELHLGVARRDHGPVQAHAWIELAGTVIIGGTASELGDYTPLLALDAKRR